MEATIATDIGSILRLPPNKHITKLLTRQKLGPSKVDADLTIFLNLVTAPQIVVVQREKETIAFKSLPYHVIAGRVYTYVV